MRAAAYYQGGLLPSHRRFLREIALQKLGFEFLEEGRFVVAQLRLDPVLRVEKNPPVSFPYAVIVHPSPFYPFVVGIGVGGNVWLQIHQATLHEQLHRPRSLHQAAG